MLIISAQFPVFESPETDANFMRISDIESSAANFPIIKLDSKFEGIIKIKLIFKKKNRNEKVKISEGAFIK